MADNTEIQRVGEVDFLFTPAALDAKAFLLPNYLDAASLRALKKHSGKEVVFFSVQGVSYPLELEGFFEQSEEHIEFIPNQTSLELASDQIRAAQNGDKLVIFAPAKVRALSGIACNQPSELLDLASRLRVPLQPLFAQKAQSTRLSIENASAEASYSMALGDVLAFREGAEEEGKERHAEILQNWLYGSELIFSRKPILEAHIGQLILRGMMGRGAKGSIVDGTDDSETGYQKILALALTLSGHIKKQTKKDRVGIVLPPGRAVLIANLAVILAKKVPVNLNFTANTEGIKASMKRADIDKIITADPFVRRQSTFPWFPNRHLILVERVLPKMKLRVVAWLATLKLCPPAVVAKLIGLPSKGGNAEAALLFTSGSSGEPKGVVLSHRNIIANVTQFSSRLGLEPEDKLMGTLPLFHSFGFTVTLWYPLIEGLSLVTYPSPLDTPKIAGLVQKHRAALLLATPTFLRGYLRRVNREQLAPLKYVVAGAEKLPPQLADVFYKKFGKEILEGYGLTETSPVTNFNMFEPVEDIEEAHNDEQENGYVIASRRAGTVGQLLAGIALRVRSPEGDEEMPINESGILWLKGANIFSGYLGDPQRSKEVLQDRWFKTGDIGRLDEEGFLHIEGRLSRFSKIAGEMVPHETVEDYITGALGIEGESERSIAIVGMPDESKGEQLVLLSSIQDQAVIEQMRDLRYALLDLGMPALWMPREVVPVAEIPVLASGKLDIKACEVLAKENSKAAQPKRKGLV